MLSYAEFVANSGSHVRQVHETKIPLYITKFGQFIAVLQPLDDKEVVEQGIQRLIEQGKIPTSEEDVE